MSRPTTDPLETLVADGSIGFRPATQFGTLNVINLNLDLHQLRKNLYEWLAPILTEHQPLRNQYQNDAFPLMNDKITECIKSDVEALLNVAIVICYNRLRNILETWSWKPAHVRRLNDYNHVSVNNKTEMPTFLASLLGSIGPIRLHDGSVDKMVVYVPTATMEIGLAPAKVERLLVAMRRCNIGLSTIDINNVTEAGRAFTTNRHVVDAGKWDTYGTVDQSFYDNEDLVRSYLFASSANGSVPVVQHVVTQKYQTTDVVRSFTNSFNASVPVVHAVGTFSRGGNPVYLSVLGHGVCLSAIMSMIYYRIVAP